MVYFLYIKEYDLLAASGSLPELFTSDGHCSLWGIYMNVMLISEAGQYEVSLSEKQ